MTILRFVLVHGSWHDAGCWGKLPNLIEAHGHRVESLNLPGRGGCNAPRSEQTLESYTRAVEEAIRRSPEPVLLVGHSAGGPVVAQAADRCAESVAGVAFIAAFLLRNGESLLDRALADEGNEVIGTIDVMEDGAASSVSPAKAVPAFYADCAPDLAHRAASSLVPEASEPSAAKLSLTGRFDGVARLYVECLNDRAISIATQRAMVAHWPGTRVRTMKTGHSPFLVAPGLLTAHLLEFAGSISADHD